MKLYDVHLSKEVNYRDIDNKNINTFVEIDSKVAYISGRIEGSLKVDFIGEPESKYFNIKELSIKNIGLKYPINHIYRNIITCLRKIPSPSFKESLHSRNLVPYKSYIIHKEDNILESTVYMSKLENLKTDGLFNYPIIKDSSIKKSIETTAYKVFPINKYLLFLNNKNIVRAIVYGKILVWNKDIIDVDTIFRDILKWKQLTE